MQATEPPALPEWEAEHLEFGNTPSLAEDRLHDPAYLEFRLSQALRLAEEHQAQTGDDRAGFYILREMVNKLRGDIRCFTDAGVEFRAILETSHPQLRWIHAHGGGFIGIPPYSRRDDPAMWPICEAAARQLRLIEGRHATQPGGRWWRGVHEGWHITVTER